MRVPGIGPFLARRLATTHQISTYEDLEALWLARGKDGKRMLGWLQKTVPGPKKFVLAKAVKGMQSEWGATVRL